MENETHNQPEWLTNGDSDEPDFSGYSSDEIDSDRAQLSENNEFF